MSLSAIHVSGQSSGPLDVTPAVVHDLEYEPGSYRDRRGRVFYHDGLVYRALNEEALADFTELSSKAFFPKLIDDGKIVHTQRITGDDLPAGLQAVPWAAVLKHEALPFVSYPYEWSFGMLKQAALLHLELMAAALDEGMILKDASAFNVQWIGTEPIFIDIPSFQRLTPGELWIGYRQFCQMFLYPLFLQAYKQVPFHAWMRGNLDGIKPQDIQNLMSMRDLFRAGVFLHVMLHAQLEGQFARTERNLSSSLRNAGFHQDLIKANVRRLTRIIRRLQWNPKKSTWSEYSTANTYSSSDRARKEEFVRQAVRSRRWKLVFDLGCNGGTFSRIAAENADTVVALDNDHLAVERLYQSLRTERNRTILPLVYNIADPPPNLGWRGAERKAHEERGKPDLILCLALVHHVVIGNNIPLQEFVQWLASLQSDLVIEFVAPSDPMVRQLLLNRSDSQPDYDQTLFERFLSEFYEIVRRETLELGTRTLYFAHRRV